MILLYIRIARHGNSQGETIICSKHSHLYVSFVIGYSPTTLQNYVVPSFNKLLKVNKLPL